MKGMGRSARKLASGRTSPRSASSAKLRGGSPSFMAEPSDGENGFSAEYIEVFFNTHRRHSALGHLSPSEYEEVRLRGGAVA